MPEEAEKAAEERENIKERIIEREREINEFPAVSIEDESVDKVSLTLVYEILIQPFLICCCLFFFLSTNFSIIC